MNSIAYLQQNILEIIQDHFVLTDSEAKNITLHFNEDPKFGDLSLNAAFIIAAIQKESPAKIAEQIVQLLNSDLIAEHENEVKMHIKKIEVARGGFVNIFIQESTWHEVAHELAVHPEFCFKLFEEDLHKKYLIEFVSANPTGPLGLGHGRNAIFGDILAKVLSFLGHSVTTEYYINDAGNQVINLGLSFKKKAFEKLGKPSDISEIQYDNEYMDELVEVAVKEFGDKLLNENDEFFQNYSKEYFLRQIVTDLKTYKVQLQNWFSEQSLHDQGKVKEVIDALSEKGFTYSDDGCVWFKSTEFGDDKDRVLVKQDGSVTYVAPDIAYHKNKFERGYDEIITILGQDHHGLLKRLHGALKALGFDTSKLKSILYQLVMIKKNDAVVRMSKRGGTFKSLSEVIETVGCDVARFFYLSKKAESHLELDLEVALSHNTDNPVYYIHYAFVRSLSVLNKAAEVEELKPYIEHLCCKDLNGVETTQNEAVFNEDEIQILKKICSLRQVLQSIANTLQPHLLANYTYELAQAFHQYYNTHRVIDAENIPTTLTRLLLIDIINNTLGVCLDLLGLSKPDKM